MGIYKETKGFTEATKDGFYYFDIETTGLNPSESKIISIQYQHLSYTTGTPFVDAKLQILKEWESDEMTILEKFRQFFIEDKDRSFFIPVGNNLDFDLQFMEYRLKHYFGNNAALEFLKDRKKVDLSGPCVMMNRLNFKDSTNILGKSHQAKNMQKWYEAKNYDRIEEYIKKEAYDFVNVFSIIYAEMLKIPNILKKFSSSEDEMTYMKIVTADEVNQLLQQGYSLMNESDISKTIFWNPKLKKHQYLLVKREKMRFGESEIEPQTEECNLCGGSGLVDVADIGMDSNIPTDIETQCPKCGGSGWSTEE